MQSKRLNFYYAWLISVGVGFAPSPAAAQVTFDLIVPSSVTIRTDGIVGLTSTNWGWSVATDQTLQASDLDALAFLSTIDDLQVTLETTQPPPDPASLFRAYHETFLGESGLPNSPETDAIDAGALTGTTTNTASSLVLDGTIARATAVDDSANPIGEHASLSLPGGNVGERDFMLRITFDDLVASGIYDQIDLIMIVPFTTGLLVLGLDEFSTLIIEGIGGTPSSSVLLPGAASAAILAGASFTLELWVDRAADAAFAAVEVEGQGRTQTPAFPTALAGGALGSATTYPRIIGSGFSGQLQLDFTEVELFLNPSEKVPVTGALARTLLVLLLLTLPRWRKRRQA